MPISYSKGKKRSGMMSLHNKIPLLTIAIPTYNRPQAIQRQVRILLPQLTHEIKLIVYDNTSPICVESLFTDSEKQKFTIYRNPVNIGAEANICRCFEACCNSEWGYVPGDDDELYPDTVKRILSQIQQYPNAIFINFGCKKTEVLQTEEAYLLAIGRDIQSFSDALWLSKGVYHTILMHENYYDLNCFSNTFMGQIIFTMSYLKKNKNAPIVRLETKLFDSAIPGGWDPLIFAKKLFSVYNFWSYAEKKQKGQKCFLANLVCVQIGCIFNAIRKKRKEIPVGEIRIILKQLFCLKNPVGCFIKRPLIMSLIILYTYFPFGKTIVMSALELYHKIK